MSFENVPHDDIWHSRDHAAETIEGVIDELHALDYDSMPFRLETALRDLYRFGPKPSFNAKYVI
jgi:hypothetical protein